MSKITSAFAAMTLLGVTAGLVTPAFAAEKKAKCDASGSVCKAGAKGCTVANCKKK